jgi:hypothetical protein
LLAAILWKVFAFGTRRDNRYCRLSAALRRDHMMSRFTLLRLSLPNLCNDIRERDSYLRYHCFICKVFLAQTCILKTSILLRHVRIVCDNEGPRPTSMWADHTKSVISAGKVGSGMKICRLSIATSIFYKPFRACADRAAVL